MTMTMARKRAVDKAEAERDTLSKLWHARQREQRDELVNGPYGEPAQKLIDFLKTMTIGSAASLVEIVSNGPWRTADGDTRFAILRLVDDAITALRERNGQPSFDDPLPGAPLNAFLLLREQLRVDQSTFRRRLNAGYHLLGGEQMRTGHDDTVAAEMKG
jgi:hypothetical protein